MFTILDFDFGGDIMQITEFPYTTSNVVGTIRRDNQFDGLVFILLRFGQQLIWRNLYPNNNLSFYIFEQY